MVLTPLACALAAQLALAPPEEAPSADGDEAPGSEASEPYRTEVVVGREREGGDGLAAQRALSRRNVGFVTAIDLEAEPGRPPADDLASVVSRAPGVIVRSLGGLGQFSAVTIRGSTSQQVPVFLDGAPLSGSASGLVDLSAQPLDALARVELYRGYVPVRFGAAAIGGAMDLVGAVHEGPSELWAVAGFGTTLAREARLGFARALSRRSSLALRLGYAGSRGDFAYFDDGGTPLLDRDDAIRRRVNNGYDRVFAQLRADARLAGVRVAHQDFVHWKLQGVPGTASAPSPDASSRRVVVRSVTRARARLPTSADRPGHVEWVGAAAIEDRVFRDLGGQVGLAADDERALTLDGWLSPRLRAPLWSQAWVELVAELRGEWIDVDERVEGTSGGPGALSSGDARRARVSAAAGAELEQWLLARRWAISAGARVDLADSRFAVDAGEGELDDAGRDQLIIGATPRVGTKFAIIEGLELRGSAGRYLRFPNLSELFGDRGYVVGNEGLSPERGTKIDGGLSLDLEGLTARELSVFASVAGFATWSEDLIQWVRSGPVVRPVNVPGARVRGLEAGLSLRAFGRDLALDLAYTLLDSRNLGPELEQIGKPLPGRPRHALLARPALRHRFVVGQKGVGLAPGLFYELEWIAGTFLDLSGRVELPPRVLHGAGLSLGVADRVELRVEGRNLSNRMEALIEPSFGPPTPYPAAISDFIGFPLPGLSVWASVRVELCVPQASTPRRS